MWLDRGTACKGRGHALQYVLWPTPHAPRFAHSQSMDFDGQEQKLATGASGDQAIDVWASHTSSMSHTFTHCLGAHAHARPKGQ